jgi:hypothetical protein
MDMVFAFLDDSLEARLPQSGMLSTQVARINGVREFCLDRKKPLTLGKFLLIGEAWDGKVDYNNDRQMKRIAEYGGAFLFSDMVARQYIAPSRNATRRLALT